jgi:hypothetical protein
MALDQITSQAIASGAVTSDAIASGAVTVADIPDGEITATKLHTTAISDKLGYTPVSPTQLSNEVAALVDSSPSALNTLNELAAALGDDPNFATTVTNTLSSKAPINNPVFTGSMTSGGRRLIQKSSDSTNRTIEFFTTISASTSNTNLYAVDTGSFNTGFYYEIIAFGGDWSNHSAARVIKRGFHCPNASYTAHSVVESSGTYASNIIYDYSYSGTTFTGMMRLDSYSVGLQCYVKLVGRIASYTVYGTE